MAFRFDSLILNFIQKFNPIKTDWMRIIFLLYIKSEIRLKQKNSKCTLLVSCPTNLRHNFDFTYLKILNNEKNLEKIILGMIDNLNNKT